MKTYTYLPIRTESTLNKREHWGRKARRNRAHREAAGLAFRRVALPVAVTLTRVAPRELDTDNLVASFKAIRDSVAEKLGADDADPRIEWRYSQRRGEPKEYAVEIQTEPLLEVVHG